MISKKKFVISIVISVLLTSFVTFTFGNYAMVNSGDRIIIQKKDYNIMESLCSKYSKFEGLLQYTKDNFLYDVDEEKMLVGGLKGMLNSLGDPYTLYMTEDEYSSLMDQTSGSFYGIGVYIAPTKDNKICVIAPIEGTPAEQAGIKSGDCIVKINGVEYTGETMDDAIKVMKGELDTDVNITILRSENGTDKTFDVDITRKKIRIQSVKSEMMEDKIGYIRITTFDSETAIDFKKQYKELEKKGMDAIVVDLRGNPGGLIDTSVEITDMFLGKGLVTYTKTKSGYIEKHPSDSYKINIPLVLLVNGGSASASEIMSGAVKDTKAGTIIGTKTYGKGIVQRLLSYGNTGEGLKMTISEYFTPSGRNIHGIGIKPDIKVELPKDVKIIGPEALAEDIQLQKAVEVLKEKLASN